MKTMRIFRYAAVLSLCFLFSSYSPPNDAKKSMLMRVVMHGLMNGHFDYYNIDDIFSKKVYAMYIKQLDVNKRFLTAEDINKLKVFEDKIDDELQVGSSQLFDMSHQLIKERIAEAAIYTEEILSKPFEFDKKESFEFEADKLEIAKDKVQVKERWRKYLKYNALVAYNDLLQQQEALQEEAKKENKEFKGKAHQELEQEARQSVVKSHKEWFDRMKSLDENDWLATYINAISATYDPHTNYFPPKDKENFDIEMSGKLEGIGATLQNSEGYIRIADIVPGSACWKQGELAVGDLILKVAQADAEPVDVVGMRTDHAVRYIRGKKGTEVRLTVRKKDGTTKIISIIRDVVELGETYAKSAVLENDKDKIGYIHLPKFYADFENPETGRRSATDIKKEVEKLKAEGVGGIILDLRNNGGGSLQDVIDMTGLFIPKGAVVQVRARGSQPQVYEDDDNGKVDYDGALVILVNSYSASASEIMAAALQDYKRAVIIGSQHTFGKGTVQRMIDLDGFLPANLESIKPLGSLKLTIQKYYRINGGATQLKGVESDIVLPDLYSYVKTGEKEEEFAMAWDKINPAPYQVWEKPVDLDYLKKRSQERIKNNEAFQLIDKGALRLKKQQDQTEYSLNLQEFRELQKLRKQESEASGKYQDKVSEQPALMLKADRVSFGTDSIKIKKQEDWLKSLRKDVYLQEGVAVIKDMLNHPTISYRANK